MRWRWVVEDVADWNSIESENQDMLRRGFTLLELMVVAATIALLAAILLPALSGARAQARLVQCQSNVRQLASAFVMYTVQNRGRLPGCDFDPGADWLGGGNRTAPKSGRQPIDGTIYPFLGRQIQVYACPQDNTKHAASTGYRSYSSNFLLCGAKPDMLRGAHYRQSGYSSDPFNFSETAHTRNMRAFDGVPMIIEEDSDWNLSRFDNAAWANTDCVSDRHVTTRGGSGIIGYADSHVGSVVLRPRKSISELDNLSFAANDHCIRTGGGKWITGRSWNLADFKYVDHALPAAVFGVTH